MVTTQLHIVHRATYCLTRPEEVYAMTCQLAGLYAQPEEMRTAIYELLFNAIEHGNLQIGYRLKGQLLRNGLLYDELQRRLALPENRAKAVRITRLESAGFSELSIMDDGDGFDWQRFRPKAFDSFNLNGRGLFIALRAPFVAINFNRSGNQVTCEMRN